jgi:PIN domain nuclease of toxin-antitoxin system
MNCVTDTHALLWWFTDSPQLGPGAVQCFEKCEAGELTIAIPTIVAAEALSIFDKKRISFDFKELFKQIYESKIFSLIPLDYPVLRGMGDLKLFPELHDKIIVSTANYLNLPIITKDKRIQSLAHIQTIW